MKVVILGPAHPYRGGIAALNERLALAMGRDGHNVRIITFTLQYPGFLFPGKTQFTDDPPPAGIIITRKINAINPLNWIRTGISLRKERPDLVIARFWIPFIGPSLGTICRIIRKNRHSLILGLADNIVPHEKKPGDRMLTAYFIHSSDGIVVMSKSVMDDLDGFDPNKPRKYGPHPIYDHYGRIYGREEALRNLRLDPGYRYMLFFGLVRDYKGLDLVIDAMKEPRLKHQNIRLIVAGEFYSDREKYLDKVKKSALEEQVLFFDRYIPNSEVEDFFNAADIVVQPYKSATQSGVTQVAYHFNKPMLVTRVGGLAEIVAHGRAGYVCQPEAGEIAEALHDFFSNDRKKTFETYVAAEKQRFGWDHFTKLFYDLKEECDARKNYGDHS